METAKIQGGFIVKIRPGNRLIAGDPYQAGTRELIPVIRRTALTCGHSAMVSAVPVAICIREGDRASLYLLEEDRADANEIEDILTALRME